MDRQKAEPRTFGILLLAMGGAVATAVALGGCNTTEGAGEDLEEAGEAIQDEADDAN